MVLSAEFITQTVISGVFLGALYGLAAVGFSFVFGVVRILNIAHGELIMLGGYAGFFLFARLEIDPFLSIPLVAAATFAIGMALYGLLYSRVVRLPENLRANSALLISFGLILILQQTGTVLFTADERSISPAYAGLGFTIRNIRLPYTRLGILAVSLLLISGLHLFLRKTYPGKAIRAAAGNWESAKLMGIDIRRTYLFSFALACSLAGVAGSMIALGYSINTAMGLEWILKVLVVSILAGVGSVGGAFLAGLLLGVLEAVGAMFMGPYTQVSGLVIFLLVLMLKPQGLFGNAGERV